MTNVRLTFGAIFGRAASQSTIKTPQKLSPPSAATLVRGGRYLRWVRREFAKWPASAGRRTVSWLMTCCAHNVRRAFGVCSKLHAISHISHNENYPCRTVLTCEKSAAQLSETLGLRRHCKYGMMTAVKFMMTTYSSKIYDDDEIRTRALSDWSLNPAP